MLAGGRKTGIQKSIWRGAILLFLPKGYTTEVVTGNSGFFLVATVCCRNMVETYAVNVDSVLHEEVLKRYRQLDIAPYKGFINPWMKPQLDNQGNIVDIELDYTESYAHQMMRYSKESAADES